jgi:diaminohydroxyphosphoribosylaminopyrimidine deaminase/5-amino-6-(5-phosphoribosylamino)uracil reductase
MSRALSLAKKGQYTVHPNPRVGCVIVKNNQIIGEGWHKRAGQPHAEINALNSLQKHQNSQGSTAYVTLEPCSHTGKTPPCANALVDSGVSRVVIAMQDPNPQVSGQGIQRLRDAGIDVEVGIQEQQARALNLGFIKRMEQGLPWVRVKLAMSLDGKTAMASGESQWITGLEARQDVQRLRASADVILTGIGTILADDPSLNVRLSADDLGIDGDVIQPTRVIIDTNLQTPSKAKLFNLEGNTTVMTAKQSIEEQPEKVKDLESSGAKIIALKKTEEGRIPLKIALQELAQQGFNEVHVEAGSTLCGALIQQHLVDEIIIYVAANFMGSDARGLLDFTGVDKMQDKLELNIQDIRAVGNDWRISVTAKKPN